MSDDDQVSTVDTVREQIRPMLAGLGPDIQGAVLADLLALWLAGHPPQLRDELLIMHMRMVGELLPINVRAIAQRDGLQNWE